MDTLIKESDLESYSDDEYSEGELKCFVCNRVYKQELFPADSIMTTFTGELLYCAFDLVDILSDHHQACKKSICADHIHYDLCSIKCINTFITEHEADLLISALNGSYDP